MRHHPTPLSVKLIGLGGVGGIVARYGALFVASLDGDSRWVLDAAGDFWPAPLHEVRRTP